MVIPCSRSARNPSVSKEKSTGPVERLMRLFLMEASWSSYTVLESCNSLPIKVDLPSSTLPAVVKRNNSLFRFCSRNSLNSLRSAVSVTCDIRSNPPASSSPWSLLHHDRSHGFHARNDEKKPSLR